MPANWKSTVAGILTAAFGFVAFSPDLFAHWPWLIALAKYAMLGGIVGLGKVAKDGTTHSTADEVIAASNKEIQKEKAAYSAH